ncbi:hypothetical protein [Mesorhizobium sp. M1406]|uniref:hypothetical protein n=1 Tax=Mesorhizobium sp. M1406 TaxID=2957099 RepID=UPI00333AE906
MVVDLAAAKHVTHGCALGLDAGEPQFQLQPSGFASLSAGLIRFIPRKAQWDPSNEKAALNGGLFLKKSAA